MCYNCSIELGDDFMLSTNKIIAITLDIAMIICYYFIPKEILFGTLWGVVVIVLFVLAVLFTNLSIAEYDNRVVEQGQKHKEKIFGFALVLLYGMLLVTTLYFIEYFFGPPSFIVVIFVVSSLILLLLYLGVAYIYDYVILTNDGLITSYVFLTKRVEIKYKDVSDIRFGKLMNTFTIETKNQTARFDVLLINSDKVLNELCKNTLSTVHKKAFEDLGTYFDRLGMKKNKQYLDYFRNKKKD